MVSVVFLDGPCRCMAHAGGKAVDEARADMPDRAVSASVLLMGFCLAADGSFLHWGRADAVFLSGFAMCCAPSFQPAGREMNAKGMLILFQQAAGRLLSAAVFMLDEK